MHSSRHECGPLVDGTTDSELVGDHAPVAGNTPDLRQAEARVLLEAARRCQQDGDLTAALRAAREALSLQPDCSTIHALLGYLYEQTGNTPAARYHFQAALTVTHACDEPTPLFPPLPPPAPARTIHGGWIALVLVGCVLFSGLAAMVTFWPGERLQRGTIFVTPDTKPSAPRTAPVRNPSWTRLVPAAVLKETAPTTAATPAAERDTARKVQPVAPPSAAPEREAASAPPPSVLGPSVRATMPVTTDAPTLEQAEQAQFLGQYERAVTLYEELLRQDERPNPQVHQELARCYQRLDNSTRAAVHLEHAVRGYQGLLVEDPENLLVQQGLRSAEAALRKLNTPR